MFACENRIKRGAKAQEGSPSQIGRESEGGPVVFHGHLVVRSATEYGKLGHMAGSKTNRAKTLRNSSTNAERQLWQALRGAQFYGFKFTRQYPIDNYVVDFCCRRLRFVIEVDGGQHDLHKRFDEVRTAHLEIRGYTVLRFWNSDVTGNLNGVLEQVSAEVESLLRGERRPTF